MHIEYVHTQERTIMFDGHLFVNISRSSKTPSWSHWSQASVRNAVMHRVRTCDHTVKLLPSPSYHHLLHNYQ